MGKARKPVELPSDWHMMVAASVESLAERLNHLHVTQPNATRGQWQGQIAIARGVFARETGFDVEVMEVQDGLFAVRAALEDGLAREVATISWPASQDLNAVALCFTRAEFTAACALYDRRCAANVVRRALTASDPNMAGMKDAYDAAEMWSAGPTIRGVGVLDAFPDYLARLLPYMVAGVSDAAQGAQYRISFLSRTPPFLAGPGRHATLHVTPAAPFSIELQPPLGSARVAEGPFRGVVYESEVGEALDGVEPHDFMAAAETVRCVEVVRTAYTRYAEGYATGAAMANALRSGE